MKLKKIKNYILTFIICLFGAFAFNSINVGATSVIGSITANEGQVYFYNEGTTTQKTLYLVSNLNYNIASTNSELTRLNVVFTTYSNNSPYTAVYYRCNLVNYVLGDNWAASYSCTGTRYVFTTAESGSVSTDSSTATMVFSEDINGLPTIGYSQGSNNYSFVLPSEDSDNFENAYNSGYNVGYSTGYSAGFDVGSSSSNTLVGMIGAIFTGPVTMLQSIFNFEFLGINLAGLFFSLLTLLVVIWLIKKFI